MGRSVKWDKKYARWQSPLHLAVCTFLCNIQARNVARKFFVEIYHTFLQAEKVSGEIFSAWSDKDVFVDVFLS